LTNLEVSYQGDCDEREETVDIDKTYQRGLIPEEVVAVDTWRKPLVGGQMISNSRPGIAQYDEAVIRTK